MRPKFEINTPERDDGHLVPFHMEVPPTSPSRKEETLTSFPFSLSLYQILTFCTEEVSFSSYRLCIILALKQSTLDE